MILGRPTNQIVAAFQAVLGLIVLVLAQLQPPIIISSAVVAAALLAFAALIGLIAGQPPTLNPGDTIKVVTPAGMPNATTTVATPPAADAAPVLTPKT